MVACSLTLLQVTEGCRHRQPALWAHRSAVWSKCRAYSVMGGHTASHLLQQPLVQDSGAAYEQGTPAVRCHVPTLLFGTPKTFWVGAAFLLSCPLEPAGQELIRHGQQQYFAKQCFTELSRAHNVSHCSPHAALLVKPQKDPRR